MRLRGLEPIEGLGITGLRGLKDMREDSECGCGLPIHSENTTLNTTLWVTRIPPVV